MPSLMMITSVVSEESLARDTQTQTERLGVVYLKLFQSNFSKTKTPRARKT